MADRVEPKSGRLDGAVAAAPAEQGLQARGQLDEGERLRQVVVAAGVEAGHTVDERVPGREEQDRRLNAARAERLAEVAAVGVGQSDVDNERVWGGRVDTGQQF